MKVYADNSATTRPTVNVIKCINDTLLNTYGNPSSLHTQGIQANALLEDLRNNIAMTLNANKESILFTSCGSESNNYVFNSIVNKYGYNIEIMVSSIEHHSIINQCIDLGKKGVKILYIPVNYQGIVDLEYIRKNISDKTKLISVMYANNEIGTIEPIKEIVEIAHINNVLVHTDAVQIIGHISIDLSELNVDFLSASAHKFNGPKGVGFLFVRNISNISSLIYGGQQEKHLRGGTENIAYIYGMYTALKEHIDIMQISVKKLAEFDTYIRTYIQERFNNAFIITPHNHIPGFIAIAFENSNAEGLLNLLDLSGICVSSGSACNTKETIHSHVLEAIAIDKKYINGVIRISLSNDNTIEEVKYICDMLFKFVNLQQS